MWRWRWGNESMHTLNHDPPWMGSLKWLMLMTHTRMQMIMIALHSESPNLVKKQEKKVRALEFVHLVRRTLAFHAHKHLVIRSPEFVSQAKKGEVKC
jgi:hypothetical protein